MSGKVIGSPDTLDTDPQENFFALYAVVGGRYVCVCAKGNFLKPNSSPLLKRGKKNNGGVYTPSHPLPDPPTIIFN